jgi:GTPase SAR1 family protein
VEVVLVTLLHLSPVGKTALLMIQAGLPYPEEYVPTIFENYISKVAVGNKVVELSLWDTAGRATLPL